MPYFEQGDSREAFSLDPSAAIPTENRPFPLVLPMGLELYHHGQIAEGSAAGEAITIVLGETYKAFLTPGSVPIEGEIISLSSGDDWRLSLTCSPHESRSYKDKKWRLSLTLSRGSDQWSQHIEEGPGKMLAKLSDGFGEPIFATRLHGLSAHWKSKQGTDDDRKKRLVSVHVVTANGILKELASKAGIKEFIAIKRASRVRQSLAFSLMRK